MKIRCRVQELGKVERLKLDQSDTQSVIATANSKQCEDSFYYRFAIKIKAIRVEVSN